MSSRYFDRGGVDALTRALDDSSRQIDLHVAEFDNRHPSSRPTGASAQMRTHAREQFARTERLDEVVVRTRIERFHLVIHSRASSKHEDGHVPHLVGHAHPRAFCSLGRG